MKEDALRFGKERNLVGIVTTPTVADPALPAVVLLNAGMMHRVGPNRVYVQLARAFAERGITTLRFDFSGMGDSSPRSDHAPYVESATSEAAMAMDWLAEQRGAERFLLMGHCAGAVVSLLTAAGDARVAGAVLLNMEGGDAAWTEYDRQRKMSRQFARDLGQNAIRSRERWAKLLTGKANYRSIFRIITKDIIWYRLSGLTFGARQALGKRGSEAQSVQQANAQVYLDPTLARGARLRFVHSQGSTGLEQVRATFGPELEKRMATGKLELTVVPESDHLFTLVSHQRWLCGELGQWIITHYGAGATTTAPNATPAGATPAPAPTATAGAGRAA